MVVVMTREKKGIFESAKDGVVGAIRGVGDVARAAVDTVSGTLVSALRGVREITTEAAALIFDTVRGVIQGVAETGEDLAKAARVLNLAEN
jgi:phage-related protein